MSFVGNVIHEVEDNADRGQDNRRVRMRQARGYALGQKQGFCGILRDIGHQSLEDIGLAPSVDVSDWHRTEAGTHTQSSPAKSKLASRR